MFYFLPEKEEVSFSECLKHGDSGEKKKLSMKEGGRKMRKKVVSVMLAAAMCVSMTACGSKEAAQAETKAEET